MHSLATKTLLALAAAALPALTVATILGTILIRDIGKIQADFEDSALAGHQLTEIRVAIGRERGLVTRLPAELDLVKVDAYAQQITAAGQTIESQIAALANERIVTPDVTAEIRATRQQMRQIVDKVVVATKSFAQTT